MTDDFKFHHIGYATDNLEETKIFFSGLGYIPGEVIHVPSQKVKVCFLNKFDHPQIELITSAAIDSPIENILKKCGSGPYHLCYSVKDMKLAVEYLKKEKFVILNRPVISNAIDDQLIIFAYKKGLGLIEIVEIPEK